MGKYIIETGKGSVEIIAGEYNGIKGPVTTFSPMNVYNAKLGKGLTAGFSFSEKYNTGFLIIDGEVRINDSQNVREDNFVFFAHEGELITVEALNDSVVLILSGEPINEPIASYGPFLMNTEAEIQKAFDDFYSGKFGYLED